MKKISFILAFLMLVSVVSPSADAIEQLQNDAVQSKYAEQYTIKTDVEDIVQDVNGNYAMVTTGIGGRSQTFVPVGRQDILLTSEESIDALRDLEGVEEETKNTVIQMAQDIQANKRCGCDECSTVSVYSPDLLLAAQTRGTSISYDEYNGHRMKVEIVSAAGHAGFASIAKGMSFENTTKTITGFVIDKALSYTGKVLSTIFGAGLSLFDAILSDAKASNVYGSSQNDVQLQILYDSMVKHTYAERTPNAGDWAVGCVSFASTIEECFFRYNFYENYERTLTGNFTILMDTTIYSENYRRENNLRTAWLNIGHPFNDSTISVKIGGKWFHLT